MRLVATTLELLKVELEQAFDQVRYPQAPTNLFACTTASMPPAADYTGAVLRNTTLNILAVSDGTNWIRQDTGAAI